MATGALAALTAVSALASAASQISQTRAQASAEEASAEQADIEAGIATKRASREAIIATRQGREQAEAARKAGRRLASAQRAKFGKAGVTLAGSPMLVLSETVEEAETEALRSLRGGREATTRILEAGEDISRGRIFEAEQRRFRAKQTRKAGVAAAGTSLLTGGEKFAGIFTP